MLPFLPSISLIISLMCSLSLTSIWKSTFLLKNCFLPRICNRIYGKKTLNLVLHVIKYSACTHTHTQKTKVPGPQAFESGGFYPVLHRIWPPALFSDPLDTLENKSCFDSNTYTRTQNTSQWTPERAWNPCVSRKAPWKVPKIDTCTRAKRDKPINLKLVFLKYAMRQTFPERDTERLCVRVSECECVYVLTAVGGGGW